MMVTLRAETASGLWQQAIQAIKKVCGRKQASRSGPTHELLHVQSELTDLRQRWVNCRNPPINVAFGIVETIGILNGRRDAPFFNFWNTELPRYAGAGDHYHGAYGYRLRANFGFDQLQRAYTALSANADSRQVVLQIWDPRIDLPTEDGTPVSPDIPCNVCSILKVRDGKLEWTQVMRSNDVFLGLPYNIVQFTTLQEVMAGWLGLNPGSYVHMSDSLHLYERDAEAAFQSTNNANKRNEESLALPKDASDAIWRRMSDEVDKLIQPRLSRSELKRLGAVNGYPEPYANLMRILVAEAARRRRSRELADSVAARCTNSMLSHLWHRWCARKKPTQSTTSTGRSETRVG